MAAAGAKYWAAVLLTRTRDIRGAGSAVSTMRSHSTASRLSAATGLQRRSLGGALVQPHQARVLAQLRGFEYFRRLPPYAPIRARSQRPLPTANPSQSVSRFMCVR